MMKPSFLILAILLLLLIIIIQNETALEGHVCKRKWCLTGRTLVKEEKMLLV